MKNKFMKIFIGVTLWTFFFSFLAIYAGAKAFHQDPDIATKIAHQLGMRFTQSHFELGGDDQSEGGAYKDTNDTWTFSLPAKSIEMKFITADIEISVSDKKEIQIQAQGALDNNLALHLIDTDFNGDELMLSEPDENAVKDLKIKIKIPKDYKYAVDIKSVSGDIHFLPINLQKVKVQTVSGDIDAKSASISDLQVETVSGGVDLEIKKIGMTAIKSISGSVHLDMMDTKDKIDFDLGTLSGMIKNEMGSDSSSPNKVIIKTTSGDIEIL